MMYTIQFIGSILGPKYTTITLGHAEIYFMHTHPDQIRRPYLSKYKMPLSYHEDEHIAQWYRDGAFKFIYSYVKEGLPDEGNSYDQEANQKAVIRMKKDGIFNDVPKYQVSQLYRYRVSH